MTVPADPDIQIPEEGAAPSGRKRFWPRALAVMAGIAVIAVTAGYVARDDIARNVIEDQLAELGLPATYDIEDIGTERQVLTNLVIGDPAAPDLTIERIEVELIYDWGVPELGRITVVKPRLFGTYQNGVLSFGSLDPVLFAESDEPAGLPEYDIELVDGRAQMLTDYGAVGIKAAGEGALNDGFAGTIAAIAPGFSIEGCDAENLSLFGAVEINSGSPEFSGPVRMDQVRCAASGIALGQTDIRVDADIGDDLASVRAKLAGEAANGAYGEYSARSAKIAGDVSYRGNRVSGDYDLALTQVSAPQLALRSLGAQGTLRLSEGFTRTELQASLTGEGLTAGVNLPATFASAITAAEGTLAAPLLTKLQDNLTRELRGSRFAADAIIRRTGNVTSAVIPEAGLRGSSGDSLLSVSRLQYSDAGPGAPRFSANLATGGTGLPRIVGRMEQQARGGPVFRLVMSEYAAGASRLAIPQLSVAQSGNGAFTFTGQMTASGPLPGGTAQGLSVPVNGTWNPAGGLALWRGCTDIQFDRLQLANLALSKQSLTLCPSSGRSILEQSPSGALRIAAGTGSLDLAGTLGESDIRIQSGAVGFAYPGAMAARDVTVELGPPDAASTFNISSLTANLGDDIAGEFSGADIRLEQVPLDLMDTSGQWSFADGILTLSDAAFRLEDREAEDRFEPLIASGANLVLRDNIVTADASMRLTPFGQEVVAADIVHNLETSAGRADLRVDDLRFQKGFQPADLTVLALGVIANAEGVITGGGQIVWTPEKITSGGSFSTEAFDFAAAFGPVSGASGTVEFSDLLNLTTAPGQTLKVASVNPGVEVTQGEIGFAISEGQILDLETGSFAFAGGTLTFQPVRMTFGAAEIRRYVIEVEGVDAATFVAGLELGNISATGVFDGTLPLIFDEDGNGSIENGLLIARAPGGNISYVGQLTYEDMTPMVNFAFDALRSLDYDQMSVAMNGSLSGELVTNVQFDGLRQGEGASRNIVTREIAKLPIKMRVNIRAPFAKLLSSLASISDPASVRDPRDLGLVGSDGRRLQNQITGEDAPVESDPLITEDELQAIKPVQGQESDEVP